MKPREYYFKEGCYITELHNREEDPACSVARARVSPGTTTRWHCLEGTAERYIILEGTGIAEVDDLKISVQPQDVVSIHPGQKQRIRNTGTTDLIFLAICTPRFREEKYEDLEL